MVSKAIRKDNRKWVVGFYFEDILNCWESEKFANKAFIKSINNGIDFEVIPETVCQCINENDRVGTPIFLGDKLEITTTKINGDRRTDLAIVKKNKRYLKIDLVVYHEGKYKRTTNASNLYFYDPRILGNIHDQEDKK